MSTAGKERGRRCGTPLDRKVIKFEKTVMASQRQENQNQSKVQAKKERPWKSCVCFLKQVMVSAKK